MIDYKELLQENRKIWKDKWLENDLNDQRICGLDDWDYDILIDWIIKNKPKTIVEYGNKMKTFEVQTIIVKLKHFEQIGKLRMFLKDLKN